MNITFLLGNGFDKAIGLNTGYTDFYMWYVNNAPETKLEHIKAFRKEIDDFVKKSESANPQWKDAELGLASYTEKFTLENVGLFIDCYEDFKDNLIVYLKEEADKVSQENIVTFAKTFSPQFVDFFEDLLDTEKAELKTFRDTDRNTRSALNIVTFNYTNVIDKICDELRTQNIGSWRGNDGNTRYLAMSQLVHAHGYVNKAPIIGVCDESLILNKELLKDTALKTIMIKSQSIKTAGEFWRRDAQELINKSSVICVFGMSLGDTDSDYWTMIASWLNKGSSRHLIIFWYDPNIKNIETSVYKRYIETEKIRNVIKKYLEDLGIQDDSIIQRIHIAINPKNMFSLPKVEV